MTELLQGSRTLHKQGAPSLLQTGATAAAAAGAAARKGCWLQFFEFCTASCLSACLSVWSIGLLCCEAGSRPGPLVSCRLYRAPWSSCCNSVLRKIFGLVQAVVGLSVECPMNFVTQVFAAWTASKCMVCKPRSGTVNVNRVFCWIQYCILSLVHGVWLALK